MKLPTNYNPDVLTCLANLSNDEVFTPPSLVNEILDLLPKEIWKDKHAKFLDPVTKTGVFLREIATRLIDGLAEEIPDKQERINHIYINQLYGIAITELTALLARRSVYCSKIANGKYSICTGFSDEQGNIRFNRVEHEWQGEKCRYCGASKSEYDREDALETHAYEFIHTDDPNSLYNNMQFDVIIGNPPYQLNDGGNGASASPIYQKFVQQSKKMNPRYLTMIIPARWYAGGKGLDDFREEMLGDSKVKYLFDYLNAKECFPGVSIGGGVCYFLWEKDYNGPCSVTNILNGNTSTMTRKLNQFSIFVRSNNSIKIIKKVEAEKGDNLSILVSSRNPFGLSSAHRGNKAKKSDNDLLLQSSEGDSYISKNDVNKGNNLINSYKVVLSKVTSEHAGEPASDGKFKILSSLKVLLPKQVCTDSYLIVGNFKSKREAEHLLMYLKGKFARFLLLQAVTSINLSKEKFVFVPAQDFTQEWTDEKLYKKYQLTKDEVTFIESMIRPIE